MQIEYIGQGWFKVKSRSIENKYHYCYPREVYCTCPSLKKPCGHVNEIYSRMQDKGIGIKNLGVEACDIQLPRM